MIYGSDCSDHDGAGQTCSGSQQVAAIRRLAPDDAGVRRMLSLNAARVMKIQQSAAKSRSVTFSYPGSIVYGSKEVRIMKRGITSLGFVTLTSCVLLGQEVTPLAFDVASVKPNRTLSRHTDVDQDGGLLRMMNVTLKSCIRLAYSVADGQINGPGWLDTERYDIVAKAAADARQDQHRLRLQALLADRFKLALRRETREASVYVLLVAKNGSMIKKEPGEPGDGGTTSKRGHVTAKAVSMAELAEFLAGPRAALGRPVVDKTGLEGVFSFTLDWTPEDNPGVANPGPASPGDVDPAPSIFRAVQEQLGLKLEGRKAPVEMLIIDHAEKIPTGN